MLGQLLLERPLHHPPGELPQHAVLAEDLPLAALAGDQLVDHPVQQAVAQLLRQLPTLGSELIQQRLDQLRARLVGHVRHRPSQAGPLERLVDQVLAQGPRGFRAPQRGRRRLAWRLAAGAVQIRATSLE